PDYETIRKTMMDELKQQFRPEFLNRVDDIIVFHKLEKTHLKEIVNKMAGNLTKRLSEQGIHITLSGSAQEKIADEGFDPEYGARPLTRAIQKHVEDNLSELILSGQDLVGKDVIVDYRDDEFKFDLSDHKEAEETSKA
ncbi:ATP-dependent Clp protease ATP-binding subunit ClpC, partial [Mammaliicoccus sciuri]|nr:ATP-dependent Clp protease ATP-binding subunit ClpC [Mammaliicoccus sciuri]